MPSSVAIVWFRQDLRIGDNRALTAAAEAGDAVAPVYVLDEAGTGDWCLGGASRWWLHGSLAALAHALEQCGSRLILRRGPAVATLLQAAAELGARSIHVMRGYEPQAVRLEYQLKTEGDRVGIDVRRYGGNLLFEPEALRSGSGEPYRVFTPFWRAALCLPPPRLPSAAPTRLPAPASSPASDRLDDWDLRPRNPDWATCLRAAWKPGKAGATERLSSFIDCALARYVEGRDRPDQQGTSMLSPHLHFGEISPAQVWHAVDLARERNPALALAASALQRQLGWRDFSYHLLHHWPRIADEPFRTEFVDFPWESDQRNADTAFHAWSRGMTGYPIVDAGMRQLWQIGWMHNRVRMIVASFLTKHMLVPWQRGARWFWDTLVDADLANNAASWQWVAGSGADAAPYFRIFNPVLQGARFDPDGDYIRRYVPELSALPAAHVHAPWRAPAEVLSAAGVRLGKAYPLPIIDHDFARRRALSAYEHVKDSKPSGAKE